MPAKRRCEGTRVTQFAKTNEANPHIVTLLVNAPVIRQFGWAGSIHFPAAALATCGRMGYTPGLQGCDEEGVDH